MTFARLTRGDWVAMVAALALLLVMSLNWYSTQAGVDARKDAQSIQPRGATAGEVARALDRSAEEAANKAEKTAWQADAFADRLVLVVLLVAVALAIASCWLRAAGLRFKPPLTPSALTTVVGLFAVVLLAARIVQKPSADIGAVVRLGAPLGLVCVGVLTIGARMAWNADRDGTGAEAGPDAGHEETAERGTDPPRPAPRFDRSEPAEPGGGATATAVRPAAAEEAASDWAPEWSEQDAGAAEPEPAGAVDRTRRRRRDSRKKKRPRRF